MSKQSNHTPGPWQVEIIGMGQDEHVCNVLAGSKQVAEGIFYSDARLIAAAPDLLEALEALIAVGKTEKGLQVWSPEWDTAHAAIAKAKGE